MATNTHAEQALERIEAHRRAIRAAEVALASEVAVARANGATWEDIARRLGVSRQAAHKTYGPSSPVWA